MALEKDINPNKKQTELRRGKLGWPPRCWAPACLLEEFLFISLLCFTKEKKEHTMCQSSEAQQHKWCCVLLGQRMLFWACVSTSTSMEMDPAWNQPPRGLEQWASCCSLSWRRMFPHRLWPVRDACRCSPFRGCSFPALALLNSETDYTWYFGVFLTWLLLVGFFGNVSSLILVFVDLSSSFQLMQTICPTVFPIWGLAARNPRAKFRTQLQ